MSRLRPADLAREHGISTQAVRNYERDGFLPPAARTPSGYRVYGPVHAAALRAYLALVTAYGHAPGGRIMRAVHDGAVDEALAEIDLGHGQALRDRETLDAVRDAVDHLTARPPADPGAPARRGPRTIGELAHRLDVTPATLRTWERFGILAPARDPATGYRVFRAADVRDAELAHLLRRGGYPLEHVATVVRQIRSAGDVEALSASLEEWRRRLTARGLAMLAAATAFDAYLALRDGESGGAGAASGT